MTFGPRPPCDADARTQIQHRRRLLALNSLIVLAVIVQHHDPLGRPSVHSIQVFSVMSLTRASYDGQRRTILEFIFDGGVHLLLGLVSQ